ncbi:MAG: GntR family transcriptional regulator [Pseudomonadota bacterium]
MVARPAKPRSQRSGAGERGEQRDPHGSESLAQQIALKITEDIVAGVYPPGSRLNEQQLASSFEVSRTPVREAVRQLVSQHLVEIKPRRGAFVTQIPMDELIHMFEFMSELEGICARFCARRMSQAEKKKLQAVHKAYKRYVGKKDTTAYFEASNEFHRLVYQGSKNVALAKAAEQMYQRLIPYRHQQLKLFVRTEESYAEHESVLEAILAGDAEAAEAAMRSHTGVVVDSVMALIAALPSPER